MLRVCFAASQLCGERAPARLLVPTSSSSPCLGMRSSAVRGLFTHFARTGSVRSYGTACQTSISLARATRQRAQSASSGNGKAAAKASAGAGSGDLSPLTFFNSEVEKEVLETQEMKGGKIQAAAVQPALVDFARIEAECTMEEPRVLLYNLHTMTDIPDVLLRSLKAHDKMFAYYSRADRQRMLRVIGDLEDAYRSTLPGKALYFRVVTVPPTGARAATRDGVAATRRPSSAASRHAKGNDKDSTSSSRNKNNIDDEEEEKEKEKLVAGVKAVLADYVVRTVEPYPREVACDVTHYSIYAPLITASRRHVSQVIADVDGLVKNGVVAKEGCGGGPPPKKALQPLTVDEVAAQIATRIRDEVLHGVAPPSSSVPGRRPGHAVTRHTALRVCIGVATSPALAKIACDAEAAFLRKHPEQDNSLVRVRSFYAYVRSARDCKQFMAHFRVAQVPTVTPAFARLLRVVFHVDTCAELYEQRHHLFFNFSPDTFRFCYAIVYGRMRFAEEDRSVLFCPEAYMNSDRVLNLMASNAIAVVNPARTSMRADLLTLNHFKNVTRAIGTVEVQLVYGRLMTEAQFYDVVRRAVASGVQRLQRSCHKISMLRMFLYLGGKSMYGKSVQFAPTHDRDTIMQHALTLAKYLAPRRALSGLGLDADDYKLHMSFGCLTFDSLLPRYMDDEVAQLRDAFIGAHQRLLSSSFYVTQKHLLTGSPLSQHNIKKYRLGGKNVCLTKNVKTTTTPVASPVKAPNAAAAVVVETMHI